MKTTIKLISLVALCLLISGCGKVSLSPIKDNLSGWSCYFDKFEPYQQKIAEIEDGILVSKQRDTWKIKDGVLICSGKPLGYLYTNDSYSDFTLTLQWRWPDEKSPGKGGVLIDTTGANKIWPKSLEAQINANSAGDFWALDGYELTGPPERTKSLSHKEYGQLVNISKITPAENPPGQWNSYKIIAKGKTVTLIINDKLVNKAARTNTSGGKICITSEGTAIEFKNIKILPN